MTKYSAWSTAWRVRFMRSQSSRSSKEVATSASRTCKSFQGWERFRFVYPNRTRGSRRRRPRLNATADLSYRGGSSRLALTDSGLSHIVLLRQREDLLPQWVGQRPNVVLIDDFLERVFAADLGHFQQGIVG